MAQKCKSSRRTQPPAWEHYWSAFAREVGKLGGEPSQRQLVTLGRTAFRNGHTLAAVGLFIDAGNVKLVEHTLAAFFNSGGVLSEVQKGRYMSAIRQLEKHPYD
jgi:hypothetical protein